MPSQIAQALAEAYDSEALVAMRAQVLASLSSRMTENIHINASSRPDGRASSGITLATFADQERFLGEVRAALAILNEEIPADETVRYTDFSAMRSRI